VQIAHADGMRGRVSAVSTLFFGASNGLGEFESGVVSRLNGPVMALAVRRGRWRLPVRRLGVAVSPGEEADRLT